MGCNTSSEPKTANEEENAKENHANKTAGMLNLISTATLPAVDGMLNLISTATLPAVDEDQKSESDKPVTTEEQAATKIQAVFRGHKTRKTMSMKAASKPEPEPSKAELEAEFRADDKELCSAASKIQASFRGHQVRKQTQKEKDQEQQDKEDIEKINLADPDLNKAATKIQASFRGHKVRKDVN